jgi:hypothetical protein
MAHPVIIEINHDLDGVHADFEHGVEKLLGRTMAHIHKRDMWKAIAREKSFFEDLKRMHDSKDLWEYTSKIDKKIHQQVLTGLPTVNDGAGQKRRWVANQLCDQIKVLVVASKDKRLHAGPGKVLIDDRQDMITPWIEAGGIGILHRSAVETIGQLKALGL